MPPLRPYRTPTWSQLVRPIAAVGLVAGLLATTSPAQCARWLASPAPAPNNYVDIVKIAQNGDLLVAGNFTSVGSTAASRIARWNGTTWSPLGGGQTFGTFYDLIELPNGDLVAGGEFSTVGGTFINKNVVRWNGAGWQAVGNGLASFSERVHALCALPNGSIVATGSFLFGGRLARFDGTAWVPLGAGLTGTASPSGEVLLTMPNGDLVVGGRFTAVDGVAANNIARWNGTTWSPLGAGLNGTVLDLLVQPNGDLIAVGTFLTSGTTNCFRIARWNGATWSPVGSGFNQLVKSVTQLPNGDLVVSGDFTGYAGAPIGSSPFGAARWNGSAWSSLGTWNSITYVVAAHPNGELWVGGQFTNPVGINSPNLIRWTNTGAPALQSQPIAQAIPPLGAAAFSVTPSPGYDWSAALTFQWRRNGVPLGNGSTPNGTVVAGVTTSILSLTNVSPLDAGLFTVAVTNGCGTTVSQPAQLAVGQAAIWTDLGNGLAGQFGTPLMVGNGTLLGGMPNDFTTTNLPPNGLGLLVFGEFTVNLPLFGGTLVPAPEILFWMVASPAGATTLPFTLPATPPSGTTYYAQYWALDATLPQGFAVSNGVRGLVP